VPIKKESGGDVDLPPLNRDSIAAADRARQDSIAAADRAREDSIARAEQMRREQIAAAERRRQDELIAAERARREAIARADSIAAAEQARIKYMRYHGGWYWGAGLGASIPTGGYTNPSVSNGGYSTGWNITVPVGYDFANSPVGVRFDLDYDELNGNNFQLNGNNFNTVVEQPDLHAWTGNLDLRLRLPLGKTWSRFYALGGLTYSNLSGWPESLSNGTQNTYTFGDSNGRWGWNAGGGFNINRGKFGGIFIESRYISVDANTVSGFPYTRAAWVPIIVGATF
jgi:hypothetical protein